MFQSVLGRAQTMIQTTIDVTVNRALVGLSFFVAAGLIAAAIAYRLTVTFGVETALIVLAALFAIVGLVAASVLRTSETPAESTASDSASSAATAEQSSSQGLFAGLSDNDREMMMGMATAALPLLAPRVIGLLLRNIPSIIVIGVVVFLLARQAGSFAPVAGSSPAPGPAE